MSHGEGLVPAILEFLEAAIHTVLKARNVYSPALFENRKLYGITVSQCRHPGVCSYIGTVLSNLGVGLAAFRGASLATAVHACCSQAFLLNPDAPQQPLACLMCRHCC